MSVRRVSVQSVASIVLAGLAAAAPVLASHLPCRTFTAPGAAGFINWD